MKILMIAPQPFFEPRGTPISVDQRLQALSALNHEIDLVTYHIGKDRIYPGVKIHRTMNIPFIKKINIGPSWSKILLDILLFIKTVQMLFSNRYDFVHSHEEAAFFCIFLSSIFRIPHLYDMHSMLPKQLENSDFGQYPFAVKLFNILERWTINSCDAVITIGADLEEQVRKVNPTVRQARLENLPINGDKQVLNEMSNHLKIKHDLEGKIPIVYTGTFEHYQGLDLLFESVQFVKEQYSNAVFLLVGGKPEQIQEQKEVVRRLGIQDSVIFTGIVSPEEALAYLEVAEILVSPRTEGLSVPLKLYTYMASGKPIVATNLYAHTQILDDSNAVLVEPEKEKFAAGIVRLIKAPELRHNIAEQAQAFAQEKFDSKNYLNKLNEICQSLRPGSSNYPIPA